MAQQYLHTYTYTGSENINITDNQILFNFHIKMMK